MNFESLSLFLSLFQSLFEYIPSSLKLSKGGRCLKGLVFCGIVWLGYCCGTFCCKGIRGPLLGKLVVVRVLLFSLLFFFWGKNLLFPGGDIVTGILCSYNLSTI